MSAVPGDLDVVVRLDLGKLRSALGNETLTELRRRASGSSSAEPELERLISDLLLNSDVVIAAFRPARSPELVDNVVVFRGRFGDVDPRRYALDPPFGPFSDLGGDVRRSERSATKVRAEPARLYRGGDELIVLVSEAEIDSVERQVDQAAGDPHVEPPEKGLVAFAARSSAVAGLFDDRSLRLAAVLEAAREIRGYADLDASFLRAEVELWVDDPEQALELVRSLGEISHALGRLSKPIGAIARRVSVEAVGDRVVLGLSLPADELAFMLQLWRRQEPAAP